jgi:hypothetical protein
MIIILFALPYLSGSHENRRLSYRGICNDTTLESEQGIKDKKDKKKRQNARVKGELFETLHLGNS